MLVNDNFRLLAGGAEAVADEFEFGLQDREIIFRSTLQHKARAKRREVRNSGDVKENILRKHGGEAGENFFRAPSLALEVDDVRLHEDRAAIAENRHGLCGECEVGVLGHVEAEAFDGGLQKISIAGRALRVELEVFHAAVM